jgi:hypothetical protein
LSVADAVSLRPRTGAWAIHGWFKPSTITSAGIFVKGTTTGDRWGLYIAPVTGQLVYYSGGSAMTASQLGLTPGTYHHLQIARFNGRGYLWVDGDLWAAGTDTHDYNEAGALTVGSDAGLTGGTSYANGDFDEIRYAIGIIQQGVIVVDGVPYARNFTPPTS